MTWDEFNEWLAYHASGFTSLHAWLSAFPETTADAETPTDPTQERILQRWFRLLESAELADAKRASDQLLAMEETGRKGFDKHPDKQPAAIAAFIRKMSLGFLSPQQEGPRIVGGEEVIDCLLCRDYGRLSAWHPESMRQAAAGELKPPYYTCALACNCRAGERYRRTHRAFDPHVDLPLRRQGIDGKWRLHDVTNPEEHEALRSFVHEARQRRRTEPTAAAGPGQKEMPF